MATQYTAGLSAGQVLTAATMNTIGAAWETWTPVVEQPGNIGITVNLARYARIQKLVVATFVVTITGTGTAGQSLAISLPLASNNTVNAFGPGFLYDASTATMYNGTFYTPSTTRAWFIGDWAAGGVWGTTPVLGVANNDVWRGTMIYETSAA